MAFFVTRPAEWSTPTNHTVVVSGVARAYVQDGLARVCVRCYTYNRASRGHREVSPLAPGTCLMPKHLSGLFMDHDPTRTFSESHGTGRVGSRGAPNLTGWVGSRGAPNLTGWVGSGQHEFKISRIGSGQG